MSIHSSSEISLSEEKQESKQDNAKEASKLLYKQLGKSKKTSIVILPSLISGACLASIYILTGKVLNAHADYLLTRIDAMDKIRNICLWVVFLAVMMGLSRFFDNFLWIQIGVEFSSDLKSKLFHALMRSDVTFFDRNSIGAILTMFGDDAKLVEENFGTLKGNQIQNIGIFLSCIIGIYVYRWQIGLIMTCLIPFFVITIGIIGKFIAPHAPLKFAADSAAITIADKAISSIRTVRSFNRENEEINRFIKKTNDMDYEAKKISNCVLVLITTIFTSLWVVIAGNLYYGGTFVRDGKMETGDLFTCFGFMLLGGLSIIELMTSTQSEQKAMAAGSRLLGYIESAPSKIFDGGETIEDFHGKIEFVNVSFKYPTREVYALKNVSFAIEAGKIGALVGHSGSGKSTCVQLIERFYDVDEGVILLDGKDIKTLDQHWLHQKISLVSQEPVLFKASIKDNIRYGARTSTDEQLIEATNLANATNFINKMDHKFEEIVGEKGSTLSGGQRQRIAIARALIRDPVILITDEATSALDAKSEKKVQQALERVMQNRTSVIVAHRLSTIQNADTIFVFHDGEIVERGTHQQLVEKEGVYYDLIKFQLEGVVINQHSDSRSVIKCSSGEEESSPQ